MRFNWLIWSGLWRKKLRTVLTMLSIVFAFALYAVLQGINQGLGSMITNLGADHLVVTSRVSFAEPLPLGHLSRIASVPGVRSVAYITFFGGYFQDAAQPINAYAANVADLFGMYPDLHIERSALDAMARVRAGAVVDAPLARQHGWKIGDHISLSSTVWNRMDGGNTWELEIVGFYDSSGLQGSWFNNAVWMNYDYLDEPRAFFKGTVMQYTLRIADPQQMHVVATAIDAIFQNSADETLTQSEQASTQTMLQQVADVDFIVNAIVGAVFFGLCFVTINTVTQALRERTADFGVLKTIGFSNSLVIAILAIEVQLLYLLPACFGMSLSWAGMPVLGKALGISAIPASVFFDGIAIAMVLAAITIFPSAMRLRRLQIVDALASR